MRRGSPTTSRSKLNMAEKSWRGKSEQRGQVELPEGGMMAVTEETMTRRPRRNHTLAFKPKVALAAIKG